MHALGGEPSRQFGDSRPSSTASMARPRPAPAPPLGGGRPRCRCAAARPRPRSRGTTSCGCGHSAGALSPFGMRERRAAVDHARQGALAPAQIVEQAEARLADEAGALSRCPPDRAPAPTSRSAASPAPARSLPPCSRCASARCWPSARRLRGRSTTIALRTPGM